MKTMTTATLLATMLATPGAFAYVSSVPSPPGKPAFGLSEKTARQTTKTTAAASSSSSSSSSYDLGIGKNKPVKNIPYKAKVRYDNVESVADFWMVQDSVHDFPMPAMDSKGTEEAQQKPPVTKRRIVPIVPNRMSEDAVSIMTEGEDALTVARAQPKQLDLNTIWVEMLIHDQQMQFA